MVRSWWWWHGAVVRRRRSGIWCCQSQLATRRLGVFGSQQHGIGSGKGHGDPWARLGYFWGGRDDMGAWCSVVLFFATRRLGVFGPPREEGSWDLGPWWSLAPVWGVLGGAHGIWAGCWG